ncbi:hypothetical protein N0V95_005461 [Ascochyta clinopodiicola]|nr:hypothetical protein N0V95_005461 [Ascochyta clinopodiicola]
MEDRSFMVPRHTGRNVLPNTPLFSRLLRYASRTPARVAIDDVRSKHQRTHLGLLSDVLALRETMLNSLDAASLEVLNQRGEVYVAIVAAGGYEYTVAMLAVLAMGAAAVPITPALPVEEAAYFIEKSRAALVLVSSLDLRKCCELEKRIASTSNEHFRGVPIGSCTYAPILCPSAILISSDRALEENAPGVVIFTSGTTGPPKGAVMRRSFVFDCALSVADHYRLTEDDVMLHVLPVHHATYLQDPEATAKAHDEEGYFRTGDIARREGLYYFIIGRASLDIIKSGGYKISALDIERELLGLPYITEAMVVGVADEEFGQRVAALVALQEEDLTDSFLDNYGDAEHILTIEDVRRDLRDRLAGYKLPTLLRIALGELPKTTTGKVQKKILGPRFFPADYETCSEVQQWVMPPSRLAKL